MYNPISYHEVSLYQWMERISKTNIAFVPAAFSEPWDYNDWYKAIDGEDLTNTTLEAALTWVQEQHTANYLERMVARWDSGSGSHIKSDCANGARYNVSWRDIVLDDPRMETQPFGITQLDENGCTRFVYRPYIAPFVIDGYPVEYRVYFDSEKLLGISSYYPQRPIEFNFAHMDYLTYAAEELFKTDEFPSGCSMDFLAPATKPDELLFLEGGPGHHETGGAHPCCFPPGKIHGIALKPLPGAKTT